MLKSWDIIYVQALNSALLWRSRHKGNRNEQVMLYPNKNGLQQYSSWHMEGPSSK